MKSKSIPELLDITPEKLTTLIPLLPENYQNFITTHFDNEYNRISEIKWSKQDETLYYCLILVKLKKLKNRNINNGYFNRKSILELLNITKEELTMELTRLRQDIQDFAIKHFDEDYNFKISYDLWSEEEKKFYYNTFLSYLKSALHINNNKAHKSLPERFSTTIEIFDKIVLQLSSKGQEIIKKYFTKDYKPKLNIEWDGSDKRYFYNYTYKRIRILLKYHEESIDYIKDTYLDLPRRLGITPYQFKYVLNFLKSEHQKFIFTRYNAEFKLDIARNLTDEERYIIRALILPPLKTAIKRCGFNSSKKEITLEEQERLNNTEKYINNSSNISYYELYILALRNNHYLSEEQIKSGLNQTAAIHEYLKPNNELVLTRKKD